MSLTRSTIRTSFADFAVVETSGTGMPVLLIHGNSMCGDVFRHQLDSPAARRYRLIAVDLPGHGRSSDAFEPERTYSIPGYAEACAHLLDALGAARPAILGWSLGGHIAIELLARRPGIAGVMLVGAPPFEPGLLGMLRAFHAHRALLLATKSKLTDREIRSFARTALGDATNERLIEAIHRTDPRARGGLFRSLLRSEGHDQKQVVARAPIPISVVNGSEEPFARLAYLAGLPYADLWDERCHVIENAGHSPFLSRPHAFNPLLERFLDDLRHGTTQAAPAREDRRSASAA
jgi:pimeloyl-ACP methyl ester carboxylesterase